MTSVSSSVGSGAKKMGGNRPGGKLSPRQLLAAQAKTESGWCDAMNSRLPALVGGGIRHNTRFANAVLRVNGRAVCSVQDAVVWVDEFGVMVAEYGDNLPSMSFVQPHNAVFEIIGNSLTIYMENK